MARLFPYSFSYFELIEDGFENPNRLFFSIEQTFYDISSKQSDLRELIPEFFYLPEMFMNINCINFGVNSKGEKVDDVVIPNMYQYKNYKNRNYNENYNKIITEGIFDEEELQTNTEYEKNVINEMNKKIIDKQDNENNIIGYFIFIYFMKNKLETLNNNLSYWINNIFGEKQRYRSINKEKGQYFKTESFIDINKKTFEIYSKLDLIKTSMEFGVIPLQSILNIQILENFKKRKSIYDRIGYKNLKIRRNNRNPMDNKNNKKIDEKKSKKEDKVGSYYILESYYWNKTLIISFDCDSFGKLMIYENSVLIKEIFDHNSKIIDVFFNKRLNIFATTSLDGLICIYYLPNKLISVIKHPEKKFFDKVYVSANPFPTIVAYEKRNDLLRSYSLSGLLIKEKKIEIGNNNEDLYNINLMFDYYGGNFKDEIIVYNKRMVIEYNIPFLRAKKSSIL